MPSRLVPRALYLVAALFLLAAIYCALWIVSSFSLAFTACEEFSLLASTFRCRQPYVALILSILFVVLSGTSIYLARRHKAQRARAST
jgi:hypothetical protein